MSLQVGWVPPDGGPAQYASTIGRRAVLIPDCRVWFIEPDPTSDASWTEVLQEMCTKRIPGLAAGGRLNDDVLAALAKLDWLVYLDLSGSTEITDAGLKHISTLSLLKYLSLGRCAKISDRGLRILRSLPQLYEVFLFSNPQITDEGISHLEGHARLQLVSMPHTSTGDEALMCLSGKPTLTHLSPGCNTTDDGLARLQQYPGFTRWTDDRPTTTLNQFYESSPSTLHLDLRSQMPITGVGLLHLGRLDGLYDFKIPHLAKDHKGILGKDVAHLASMPNLRSLSWTEHICNDDALRRIARIAHLSELRCQGAVAGDVGFAAL